jgi:chromosome segregation ATPase
LTKLSLASYEKLIEKLQGQLENLSNEKARLQQYKNSKSKRYEELVNKMKGLEILGNIDLDRILAELKSRDRKIGELDIENKAQKDELTYVVHQ